MFDFKWQCEERHSDGTRCPNRALHRIHFDTQHPFNHTDLCDPCLELYKSYLWYQPLVDEDGNEYGERNFH